MAKQRPRRLEEQWDRGVFFPIFFLTLSALPSGTTPFVFFFSLLPVINPIFIPVLTRSCYQKPCLVVDTTSLLTWLATSLQSRACGLNERKSLTVSSILGQKQSDMRSTYVVR